MVVGEAVEHLRRVGLLLAERLDQEGGSLVAAGEGLHEAHGVRLAWIKDEEFGGGLGGSGHIAFGEPEDSEVAVGGLTIEGEFA